jgi:ring-1,2-phenylacetyl-CoA epoxidase subunit PaaE
MSTSENDDTGLRHQLHRLRVSDVEEVTDDSIAITFDVPAPLRGVFSFRPGQHVALELPDGDGVRRSYSICSPEGGPLRVGVKHLPNGAFSTFIHERLRPGDQLAVLPPSGRFTTALDPSRSRHYAAIAAGSGITPVLSVISSALAAEPESRCTLVYGNRTSSSVMFLEELEDLKNLHRERLHLIHILSREHQDAELMSGRIDGPKLRRLLQALVPVDSVDEWFLCGPFGMVQDARDALLASGVPSAAIHRELFHTDAGTPIPAVRPAARGDDLSSVEVRLDGRRTVISVARDGTSILDALLAERPDAPYACKGGVCGTCRCRLVEGNVTMARSFALEEDELAAGLVLACQSHPTTDTVVVDFDAV